MPAIALPPSSPSQNLVLFDYDWASANDEIGRALVRVQDLAPGQPADLWLDVTSGAGVERGRRLAPECLAPDPSNGCKPLVPRP